MSLHNIDCMKFMRTLDDNSVDFTLTDIPYDGVNEMTKIRVGTPIRNIHKGKADEITFDLDKFCEEVFRITRGGITIFCGNEQMSTIFKYFKQKQIDNHGTVRLLIWHKTNPSPMNGEYVYLNATECAVYFRKHKATFNPKCKHNVFEFPIGSSELHPTEKNHELLKDLILDNTKEYDIVFDPCMGSGSTLYVAKALNRCTMGCELDKNYFEIAKKRIELAEQGIYNIRNKTKEINTKKLF